MSTEAAGQPDGAERDMLAAELVIGLLDPADRRRVLEQAATDPVLRAAIAAWSVRLEPLADAAPAAAPSPRLWRRISADIGAMPPASLAGPGWKIAAMLGLGLAAGLATALVSGARVELRLWAPATAPQASPAPQPVPPPQQLIPPPRAPVPLPAPAKPVATAVRLPAQAVAPKLPLPRALALLGAASGEAPAAKALVSRGAVRVEMLRPVRLPADREMALWVWPRGEREPILLGKVSPEGGVLRFPYAIEDGTPVMITDEARGLPVAGLPGPTLLQGQLVLVE